MPTATEEREALLAKSRSEVRTDYGSATPGHNDPAPSGEEPTTGNGERGLPETGDAPQKDDEAERPKVRMIYVLPALALGVRTDPP